MYRYIQKHIELFKQIPFDEFPVKADFINKITTNPEEYGTYTNLLKCYYFISDEMYDFTSTKPLVQYNKKNGYYYFYDFVKKRNEFIKERRYKRIKMFNDVLDKNGVNRHFKKHHGLIIKGKNKKYNPDVEKLKGYFREYSYAYNQDLKYYNKHKMELPTDWAEHLYDILRELSDKAIFFYKQPGSFILAQEMANVLSNQHIFLYSRNLIRYGHNRQKIMRQIREAKQFMFGEIKHNHTKVL